MVQNARKDVQKARNGISTTSATLTRPAGVQKNSKKASRSVRSLNHTNIKLLGLVGRFLKDNGFERASEQFEDDIHGRSSAQQLADYKSQKSNKDATSDLVNIFTNWSEEKKQDPQTSALDDEEGSSSSSSSESGSESDSKSNEESEKAGAVEEKSESPHSSSSEGEVTESENSSSSSEDEGEPIPPSVSKKQVNGTKPDLPIVSAAKANPLKRKAPPSSLSSSASSSSSSSSDLVSDSESDRPTKKALKRSSPEAKTATDSEGSNASFPSTSKAVRHRSPTAESVSGSESGDDASSASSSSTSSSSSSSSRNSASSIEKSASEEEASTSDDESSSSGESLVESEEADTSRKKSPKAKTEKLRGQPERVESSDSSETLSGGSGVGSNGPAAKKKSGKQNGKTPDDKAPPKPFSRIPKNLPVDPRFGSNAYVAYDYADQAYRDLSVTKGRGFTKEKNKKKRGAYRGGVIDTVGLKGVKFED